MEVYSAEIVWWRETVPYLYQTMTRMHNFVACQLKMDSEEEDIQPFSGCFGVEGDLN